MIQVGFFNLLINKVVFQMPYEIPSFYWFSDSKVNALKLKEVL